LSQEPQAQNPDQAEIGARARPAPPEVDFYLQDLVAQANRPPHTFEPPMTLFVSGMVITGRLIGGKAFFAGLREQLTGFFGGPDATEPEVLDFFTKDATELYDKTPEPQGAPPSFIHLAKAQVFTPGQAPMPTSGSFWRGRISQVDGWHFGSLGVEGPNA
jgi:hypothetical protein